MVLVFFGGLVTLAGLAVVSVVLVQRQAAPPGGLTLEQLRRIWTLLSEKRARQVLPYLLAAMAEAEINTRRRRAAFLSQVGHESGEGRYTEEIASGDAYEGRRDLGNIQTGDGRRFKGRGLIQVTGRKNYGEAGAALGLDLLSSPELAATPEVSARVAAWYWRTRSLNELADRGDFDGITRRINGGFNGKPARDAYYARALEVLT
jgi:putative chitinase